MQSREIMGEEMTIVRISWTYPRPTTVSTRVF
jgi:hypothetical protein